MNFDNMDKLELPKMNIVYKGLTHIYGWNSWHNEPHQMDGSIYVQESYHMDESEFHELKL
jgi:hypothetical protein